MAPVDSSSSNEANEANEATASDILGNLDPSGQSFPHHPGLDSQDKTDDNDDEFADRPTMLVDMSAGSYPRAAGIPDTLAPPNGADHRGSEPADFSEATDLLTPEAIAALQKSQGHSPKVDVDPALVKAAPPPPPPVTETASPVTDLQDDDDDIVSYKRTGPSPIFLFLGALVVLGIVLALWRPWESTRPAQTSPQPTQATDLAQLLDQQDLTDQQPAAPGESVNEPSTTPEEPPHAKTTTGKPSHQAPAKPSQPSTAQPRSVESRIPGPAEHFQPPSPGAEHETSRVPEVETPTVQEPRSPASAAAGPIPEEPLPVSTGEQDTRVEDPPEILSEAPEEPEPSASPSQEQPDEPVQVGNTTEQAGNTTILVPPAAPVLGTQQGDEGSSQAASASEPQLFRVEFRVDDPDIEEIEIKCHQGSAKGHPPVVINDAGKGPCRVTGLTTDGVKLVSPVVLTGAHTFTCFANGERRCF